MESIERALVDGEGWEDGRAVRELDVGTYSAMGWFWTTQTSTRFGRWNWMSAPD